MRFVARPPLLLIAMGVVVAVVLMILLGMDPGFRQRAADAFGYGGVHSDDANGSRDLFHTAVSIRGRRGGETYAEFDTRRDAAPEFVGFHGFGCLGNCDQHEAGYRWAARGVIADASMCRGSSWQFTEGCAAFVLNRPTTK